VPASITTTQSNLFSFSKCRHTPTEKAPREKGDGGPGEIVIGEPRERVMKSPEKE
jgi:hypothetical protein